MAEIEIGGIGWSDTEVWRMVQDRFRANARANAPTTGVPGNPDAQTAGPAGPAGAAPGMTAEETLQVAGPPPSAPSGTGGGGGFEDPVFEWIRGLRRLATTDPDALRETQMRLWALGHYPDGVEPDWGEWDQDTLRAVLSWTRDAQFETVEDFNVVTGEVAITQRPFDDVLRDHAESIDLDAVGDAPLAADPATAVLASPQQAVALLEQAYARAGRVPTSEDKRAFVSVLHAFQRQRALAEARFKMQVEDADEGDLVEMPAGSPSDVAADFAREDLGSAIFEAQPAIAAARSIERNLGPA